MAGFTVRSTRESDWREVRELRVAALRDPARGFSQSPEDALARPESEWRLRAARGERQGEASVVAIADAGGAWIGSAGGRMENGHPMLVGVYIRPAWRGSAAGVTDALLSAVEDWARAVDDLIQLGVFEDNARAIAAYAKRGYRLTGESQPGPLDPSRSLLIMRKRLT